MLELPPEIIFNRYPISLSTAETNRLIIKISSSLGASDLKHIKLNAKPTKWIFFK